MRQQTFGWSLTDIKCDSCQCFFDSNNLLPREDIGVWLCLDCINDQLKLHELSDEELLQLAEHDRVNED